MLVFDESSEGCRAVAARLRELLPAGYEVVPADAVDLARLGLTSADAEGTLWWVDIDGSLHEGAAATARATLVSGQRWAPAAHLALLPPLRWLARPAFRTLVATPLLAARLAPAAAPAPS